MKLAADNNSLAEGKVLILYILNNLKDPITNNELYKLVLLTEEMNYFYFQQFLFDLIERKDVSSYETDGKTLYNITDAGKYTLSLTSDIIPGIVKFNIDNKMKKELEEINEEASITSEFIPQSENDFTVICKITEKHKTIFEIQTFAGSREQAQAISDNWKTNAINIYPKILDMLTPRQKK